MSTEYLRGTRCTCQNCGRDWIVTNVDKHNYKYTVKQYKRALKFKKYDLPINSYEFYENTPVWYILLFNKIYGIKETGEHKKTKYNGSDTYNHFMNVSYMVGMGGPFGMGYMPWDAPHEVSYFYDELQEYKKHLIKDYCTHCNSRNIKRQKLYAMNCEGPGGQLYSVSAIECYIGCFIPWIINLIKENYIKVGIALFIMCMLTSLEGIKVLLIIAIIFIHFILKDAKDFKEEIASRKKR